MKWEQRSAPAQMVLPPSLRTGRIVMSWIQDPLVSVKWKCKSIQIIRKWPQTTCNKRANCFLRSSSNLEPAVFSASSAAISFSNSVIIFCVSDLGGCAAINFLIALHSSLCCLSILKKIELRLNWSKQDYTITKRTREWKKSKNRERRRKRVSVFSVKACLMIFITSLFIYTWN